MLIKYIALLVIPVFLCSCASTHKCEPTIITKEVKVPVYQPLNIKERPTPKLPVNSLKADATPKEVAVAYDKSIVILLNEVKIYQNLIKTANKK
jgi:hypothetical protein